MFNVTTELKSELRHKFHEIKSSVSELTLQSILPAKGAKRLESICEKALAAHDAFQGARREQNARDPESKALLVQLSRIHNTASSLLDVINLEEAGSEDIPSFKKEMAELIHDFNSMAKEMEKANEDKALRQLGSTQDDPVLASREDSLHRALEQESRSIQKYARFRAKMPSGDVHSMGDKKLLMFDMPVIPLLEFPLTLSHLASIGIEADQIGLYPVLNDQRIIGVNPKALDDQSEEEYVEQVIKQFNKRTGKKYMLVSDQPNGDKKSGLKLYWVMEQTKLSKLIQLTHGAITEWGFPFL